MPVGKSEKYFSSNCECNFRFFIIFAVIVSATGTSYVAANGIRATVDHSSARQLRLFAFFYYSSANDFD